MITKELANKLVGIAAEQLEKGLEVKRRRIKEIQENVDFYYNKTRSNVSTYRANVAVPIVPGFVDTLKSKIDDPPKVNYIHTELADLKRAKKVSAAWEVDSAPTRGKWAIKDLAEKDNAIFSGVGISKYFAESPYLSHLEIVDYMDFYCESRMGWDLEKHKYAGQINIEKTETELQDELYDKTQVRLLTLSQTKGRIETNLDRITRLQSLGVTFTPDKDTAETTYSLAEHGLWYQGKKYYLLFEPVSKLWIRAEEWKDVFGSDDWHWVAWHTHPSNYNFWSKAPIDDIKHIAKAMKLLINYGLDNVQKRVYAPRAYDVNIFTKPKLLQWAPDRLIPVNVNDMLKSVGNGIFEFQTPDNTSIIINMTNFLNSILGQKTGVNPESQGQADSDKVGITFLNIQQAADRIGLYNKYYRQAWAEKGKLYWLGLKTNVPEDLAVKMIGTKGIEWELITKEDLQPMRDFDIQITGGTAELQMDEIKKKQRMEGLGVLIKSGYKLNEDMAKEEVLRSSGFEEDEIRRLTDLETFGSQEIVSEADQAVQDIILSKGKEMPELNYGATSGFLQYIKNFAGKNRNKFTGNQQNNQAIFEALMNYLEAHIEIAAENMARQALNLGVGQGGNLKGIAGLPAGQEVSQGSPESIQTEMSPSIPALSRKSIIGRSMEFQT